VNSSELEYTSLESLVALTLVYSHTRYFHPSANGISCDWEQFLKNAVTVFCKSHSEATLLKKLKSTFNSLVDIRFIREGCNSEAVSVTQIDNEKKQYWQHFGVFLGDSDGCYRSELISHNSWIKQQPDQLNASEWIRLNVLKGWDVVIPLFGDNTTTANTIQKPTHELKPVQSNKAILLLSDTILSWSILYHFYPYPEYSEIRELNTLKQALSMALDGNNQCLNYLTHALNDGHAHVVETPYSEHRRAVFPFSWEVIDNQVVITKADGPFLSGDIIESVNGERINLLMTECKPRFSGKPEFCQYLAYRDVLTTHLKRGSVFTIKRNGNSFEINTETIKSEIEQKMDFELLEDNIVYFDLTKNSVENLLPKLSELNQYRGVIFDLRGYPIDADILLPHLLTSSDQHESWMRVPIATNPNHHMSKFESYGWGLETAQPHIDIAVCFLTNIKAVSYSESILAIVKHYNLGTIIGENTAGANGDVHEIRLMNGGAMYFTGMKVSLLDGSQLHCVGIPPDIEVKQTFERLKYGNYDEIIEAGINHIKSVT